MRDLDTDNLSAKCKMMIHTEIPHLIEDLHNRGYKRGAIRFISGYAGWTIDNQRDEATKTAIAFHIVRPNGVIVDMIYSVFVENDFVLYDALMSVVDTLHYEIERAGPLLH